MANVTRQRSLWDLPRNMLPRRRSRDAPELMVSPAPEVPEPRRLNAGEQLTPDMDVVILHESGQVYRCVGSMWCGAEQLLLLVKPEQLEQHQTAAKRVVSRESVRILVRAEKEVAS